MAILKNCEEMLYDAKRMIVYYDIEIAVMDEQVFDGELEKDRYKIYITRRMFFKYLESVLEEGEI